MKTVRLLFVSLACITALAIVFSFGVSAEEELNYGKSKLAQMERAEDYIGAYNAIYAAVKDAEGTIDLSEFHLSQEELKMVYTIYANDSGEHYRLPQKYGFSTLGGMITKLKLEYLEGFDDIAYREAVDKYVSYAKDATSEYEKALILHDALVKDIAYIDTDNAHNSYGALVEGKAVCEGYTEAYQVLLEEVGIMSYKVSGLGDGVKHAWNLVRLDGKFYYTDVTWDDPIIKGVEEHEKPVFYAYFNVPEKYLHKHVAEDVYGILPECTDVDKMYTQFTYMESYTVQNVADALKKADESNIAARLYYVGEGENYFKEWFNENWSELSKAIGLKKGDSVSVLPCGAEIHIDVIRASEKHVYDNACDTDCNVCGAERKVTHDCGDKWRCSEKIHWQECTLCGIEVNVGTHSFDNACDTDCNTCGYTREITHSYGDEWISDDEYHWQKCSVCGEESEKEEHSIVDGVCGVCGACNKDADVNSGDLDGVDGVDANDAIYLLYHVFFGNERYPVDQACDYDGNSTVEAADAIYLLYHVFFGAERYPLN